jgi:hypothetical protein
MPTDVYKADSGIKQIDVRDISLIALASGGGWFKRPGERLHFQEEMVAFYSDAKNT